MATATTHSLIHCVRRVAAAHLGTVVSDDQLLERFADFGDEAAFAALVRRHGPGVLSACRRVLNDQHTAEDAFQATFLVLARKAGILKQPQSLGAWLHGVATRTALKARAQFARRRHLEKRVAVDAAVEPEDDLVWRDLRPVLDEAVAGLPESYRVPFVLHHLEGATVAEVARRLGRPQGTVAGQLARAKERLQSRLTQRGITLSASAFAVALSARTTSACLAMPLLVSTVRAATVAVGNNATTGAAATMVAGLMQGGEKMMLLTKVKIAVGLLLVLGAVRVGGSQFGGKDDARQVAEARKQVDTAYRTFPELARTKGEFLEKQLKTITAQQADKDFKVAEYYRRTGHPGAANFYYELIRRRFPGTKVAEKAAERQREMREEPAETPKPKKEMPPKPKPPVEEAVKPFGPLAPTAEQLIAYLNENRSRMPVLQCDQVSLDLKMDIQAIGVTGRLVIQQPHEVRGQFNALGKPVFDLGSNDQGWWYWCWQSKPSALQASRTDLVRGAADWPCPLGPESLVWIMGMKKYDPAAPVEVVVRPHTIELVEKAKSPQGKPLRMVTVFNRYDVAPPKPQIQGYRVEDSTKKELLRVDVREVGLERASGAVVPVRLRLTWPTEKTEVDVRLHSPEISASLKPARSKQLFTPPEVITEPPEKP